MSKQKLFLILISVFSVLKLVAQNKPDQLLKVVPPSPGVAALGKYGEIPVGLYTGVPNISIPLYEIKDGDLELPISLSYHAGGIKVEEIASSVGLGWALNAGGVLGRNVRGLPDEIDPWQQPAGKRIDAIIRSNDADRLNQLVRDVQRGDVDGEADIYYFNFDNYSGKFIYDQAGNVHLLPNKNLKVEPYLNGWRVITENGSIYAFMKEESVSSAGCGGDETVTSAWYLTNISSSDGKRQINFSYEPVFYTYQTLLGQTKYFSVNGTGGACLTSPSPCLGTQHYRTHRLVKIDFNGGFIRFNYNNFRSDLVDDKSLDSVVVYSARNELIKKYTFTHSYFGKNTDGVNRFTEHTKRLKLVSVTEGSASGQHPPYTFEYNETIELPDRMSYSQDHWGFYNNKPNSDLIASFSTPVISGEMVYFPGADRKTNPATAQAGILNKIKYPTGGETVFTYESNTVSDNRGEPDYRDELMVLTARVKVQDLPSPFQSSSLVIPAEGARVSFRVSGLDDVMWQGCDIVQCQVIKDNNPIPYTTLSSASNGGTERWPAGTYRLKLVAECSIDSRADFSVTVIASILVPSTTKVRPVGGLRVTQVESKPGGGAPSVIKKYRYHPVNDTTTSSGVLINFPDYGYDLAVTSYSTDEYGSPYNQVNKCAYRVRQSFSNYPLATTQGSYVGYSHVIEDLGEQGESWHSFETFPDFTGSGFPFAPVESFDWRRGFESRVRDFTKRNHQLTLAREVLNSPTHFNGPKIFGIKTGVDNMLLRNGTMALEFQPIPKYSFYPTSTEFFALGQTKERLYDQIDTSKFIETITDYTYSPQHLQLVQTKTRTSKSNEAMVEEVVTNKKYPFDYSFTGVPVGPEAAGIKNLQNLHITNAVIEEYTFKQKRSTATGQVSSQRVVDGSITIFKDNKPYPDQILGLEIGSPVPLAEYGNGSLLSANTFLKNANAAISGSYKPQVIFNSYDEKGNITTQQKANDVKKAYIWGYHSKYPVAEVTGADYATIMSSSNLDTVILQHSTANDEMVRAELNKVRTKFPAAQVSTFTYKPLVGVSSQTDMNNRTTYYEYDSFGRLVLVRDQDKNILKRFCYNYNGQQGGCAVNTNNP